MPKKINHKNQHIKAESKQKHVENQVIGILNTLTSPSANYLKRQEKKEANKIKGKLIKNKIKELVQENNKNIGWEGLTKLKQINKANLENTLNKIKEDNDKALKIELDGVEQKLFDIKYETNQEVINTRSLLREAYNLNDMKNYSTYGKKLKELRASEVIRLASDIEFQESIKWEVLKITEKAMVESLKELNFAENKMLNKFGQEEQKLFLSLAKQQKSFKDSGYGQKLKDFKNALEKQENGAEFNINVNRKDIAKANTYYKKTVAYAKALEKKVHDAIVNTKLADGPQSIVSADAIFSLDDYMEKELVSIMPVAAQQSNVSAYATLNDYMEKVDQARLDVRKVINAASYNNVMGQSLVWVQDNPGNYEIIKLIEYINDPRASELKQSTSEMTGANYFDRLIGSYFTRKHIIGDREEELYKALKNNIAKFMPAKGRPAAEEGILSKMDIAILSNDKDLVQKLINEIDFKNKTPLEIKSYFKVLEFSKDYLKLKAKYDNIAYNEKDIGNLKILLSYTLKKDLGLPGTLGYFELKENSAEISAAEVNIDDLNKIVYGYRHHDGEITKVNLIIIDKGKETGNSKSYSKYLKELVTINKSTDLTMVIGNCDEKINVSSLPEIVKNIKLLYPNLKQGFVQIIAHGGKGYLEYGDTIKEIFNPNKPLATKTHVHVGSCYSGQYDEAILPDSKDLKGIYDKKEFILTTAADKDNISSAGDMNIQQWLNFYKNHPDGYSSEDVINFINSNMVNSVPQISYSKNGIKYNQTTIKKYCAENNALENEKAMSSFSNLINKLENEYDLANNDLKKQVAKIFTINKNNKNEFSSKEGLVFLNKYYAMLSKNLSNEELTLDLQIQNFDEFIALFKNLINQATPGQLNKVFSELEIAVLTNNKDSMKGYFAENNKMGNIKNIHEVQDLLKPLSFSKLLYPEDMPGGFRVLGSIDKDIKDLHRFSNDPTYKSLVKIEKIYQNNFVVNNNTEVKTVALLISEDKVHTDLSKFDVALILRSNLNNNEKIMDTIKAVIKPNAKLESCFIDFDAFPSEGVNIQQVVEYVSGVSAKVVIYSAKSNLNDMLNVKKINNDSEITIISKNHFDFEKFLTAKDDSMDLIIKYLNQDININELSDLLVNNDYSIADNNSHQTLLQTYLVEGSMEVKNDYNINIDPIINLAEEGANLIGSVDA